MTDDIVIRLRKAHEEAKQWIEGGRWLCPKTIHSEAADEIELLRKIATSLYEETKRCGTVHDAQATYDFEQWMSDRDLDGGAK